MITKQEISLSQTDRASVLHRQGLSAAENHIIKDHWYITGCRYKKVPQHKNRDFDRDISMRKYFCAKCCWLT